MRITPVSIRSHQRAVSFFVQFGLATVQFVVFSLVCTEIDLRSESSLSFEGRSKVLLLSPIVVRVSVKTSSARVSSGEILPYDMVVWLYSLKDLGGPVPLETSGDWMVNLAVILPLSWLIVPHHIRIGESVALPLALLFRADSRGSLHCFGLSFGSKDIRVLVGLTSGAWLDGIASKLPFSSGFSVFLQG